MKKLKAYLDTSVVGALFDNEDMERVKNTRAALDVLVKREKYDPFISNILIEEIDEAPDRLKTSLQQVVEALDFGVLMENDESAQLVDKYMGEGILNKKYRDDARHVALSVVNGMDFVISWNCKHLCNIQKKRKFNAVNLMMGYREIDIVTPLEVIGDE
jgi:hypothetical protein